MPETPTRATKGARLSLSRRAATKRWDKAIDRVLNSGLMYPYMEDFWRFVDGEITYDEFNERMSP